MVKSISCLWQLVQHHHGVTKELHHFMRLRVWCLPIFQKQIIELEGEKGWAAFHELISSTFVRQNLDSTVYQAMCFNLECKCNSKAFMLELGEMQNSFHHNPLFEIDA